MSKPIAIEIDVDNNLSKRFALLVVYGSTSSVDSVERHLREQVSVDIRAEAHGDGKALAVTFPKEHMLAVAGELDSMGWT